jgi:tRNA-modifying protein YgfZ
MTSKPPIPSPEAATVIQGVLRGGVLEVSGRDAEAFLQAQLMNDVRALADLRWQWNGWLTAKGRVVALFALLRLTATDYRLLLPDVPAAWLASELARFRFRSKVDFVARGDLETAGFALEPGALEAPAQLDLAAWTPAGAVCLDFSGARARSLVVGDAATLASASRTHDAARLGFRAWRLEDLAHGLPRLDPQPEQSFTPQMLGLARLRAYSVKKGCYPGQEIVARTHFLGQARRELRRLQSGLPLVAGDVLESESKAVGDVICAEADTNRHESIAVLPVAESTIALLVRRTGASVRLTEFDHGLAR